MFCPWNVLVWIPILRCLRLDICSFQQLILLLRLYFWITFRDPGLINRETMKAIASMPPGEIYNFFTGCPIALSKYRPGTLESCYIRANHQPMQRLIVIISEELKGLTMLQHTLIKPFKRTACFHFEKVQGHQGIFSSVKGTLLSGNCKFLLEHFKGTKAMTRRHAVIAFVAP